jgi:hypothetical protein
MVLAVYGGDANNNYGLANPATITLTNAFVNQPPAQRAVESLYLQLLHRTADMSGMNTFGAALGGGMLSNAQVAMILETSPEGRLNQVNDLYMQILRRPVFGDASGSTTWTNFLLQGGTLAQLSDILYSSLEYLNTTVPGLSVPPTTDPGSASSQSVSNDLFLEDLLGDTRKTNIGTDFYVQNPPNFRQQLDSGVADRATVVAEIMGTAFAQATVVNTVYSNLLGRQAETAGLNLWVNAMRQGLTEEGLIALISGSPEFNARAQSAEM